MHDITAQVQEAVKESGIQEGFCIVHCNHTTAGLLVTSFWDKRGHVDFMEELDKIVPTRYDYRHQFDTPTDAAGHIKTAPVRRDAESHRHRRQGACWGPPRHPVRRI